MLLKPRLSASVAGVRPSGRHYCKILLLVQKYSTYGTARPLVSAVGKWLLSYQIYYILLRPRPLASSGRRAAL